MTTYQKPCCQHVHIPLRHVSHSSTPSKTGVKPTKVVKTQIVKELSQGAHIESLAHLPISEESNLKINFVMS